MTLLTRILVMFAISVYAIAAPFGTTQTQIVRKDKVHSQSLRHRQNKRHHRKNASMKPASNTVRPATSTDAKKAGEFKGDVRDLPQTGPVKRELPKREDPKVQPRPYPTPTPDQQ